MKKRKIFIIEYESEPPSSTVETTLTEVTLQNILEREFPFHVRFEVKEVK